MQRSAQEHAGQVLSANSDAFAYPTSLFLYERSFDDVVARLADMRRDRETTGVQKRASIRQHSRTSAYHDAIFFDVQRRKAEVLEEFARLNESRQTAVVRMRLARDRRVVMQFLADQITEEFVLTQILDQMFDDRTLAYPADTMDEDNVFEPFIDFRVLNDAHERRGTRTRAQQIEPLAGLQIVQDERPRRLAADQNRIALSDVLQA